MEGIDLDLLRKTRRRGLGREVAETEEIERGIEGEVTVRAVPEVTAMAEDIRRARRTRNTKRIRRDLTNLSKRKIKGKCRLDWLRLGCWLLFIHSICLQIKEALKMILICLKST